MATVRVATFNAENLFARFKFNSDVDPKKAVKDGWDANKTYFTILNEDEKKLTGKLIRSLGVDVIPSKRSKASTHCAASGATTSAAPKTIHIAFWSTATTHA